MLTFDYKKHLWSMAVCDTAQIDADEVKANTIPNNGSSSSGGGNHRDNRNNGGPLRVTILEDPVVGKAKLPGGADGGTNTPSTTRTPPPTSSAGNNNSNTAGSDNNRAVNKGPAGVGSSGGGGGSSRGNASAHPGAAMGVMPHQRHGHTCFVWDPRDPVLTSKHDVAAGGNSRSGRGPGLSPSSPQRGQKKVLTVLVPIGVTAITLSILEQALCYPVFKMMLFCTLPPRGIGRRV